ncbi:hypothetical protein MMC26_007345 [Xylographa opegraphella]|nr:hypothetical protein [Xylographa opegraphella]
MAALASRKGWLPREGFTADVFQSLIQKTVLNPVLTLPLLLLARYARNGEYAVTHALALSRLKICLYLGLARWANGFLNRGALNNWTSDSWDWEKELVVITGGSDGIGKVLVQLFATLNARILILDIQEPTFDLRTPAILPHQSFYSPYPDLVTANSRVHYLPLDLSSPSTIAATSSTIRYTYGAPTVLILNAGIVSRRSLLTLPDALLTRIFAINTLSHYRLVREFLPAIAAANHGAIVTIASLAGFVTAPGLVDYASTKASAIAFHEGLTAELKYRYAAPKVRTVCVCPNFTRTKLLADFKGKGDWMTPVFEVETVAEAIFERVLSGQSGFVLLPQVAEWSVMTVRSWPWWLQSLLVGTTRDVMRPAEEVEEAKDRESEMASLLAEKEVGDVGRGRDGGEASVETGHEGDGSKVSQDAKAVGGDGSGKQAE